MSYLEDFKVLTGAGVDVSKFFGAAYEVGIFSSYSKRICYRRIATRRTNNASELHAALRTVFENHCSTSNTTPASYDVTVLVMIKPKKHQRLVDLLLQSGIVARNNRV